MDSIKLLKNLFFHHQSYTFLFETYSEKLFPEAPLLFTVPYQMK